MRKVLSLPPKVFFSMAIIEILLLFGLLIGAQSQAREPDPIEYDTETKLMINVCNKFAGEKDAAKLNKVAMAMQLNRTINCIEFMGECKAYISCLSTMIRVSRDGTITEVEREQMHEAVADLKSAGAKGKDKLRRRRR